MFARYMIGWEDFLDGALNHGTVSHRIDKKTVQLITEEEALWRIKSIN
jgi:hypothetical protein